MTGYALRRARFWAAAALAMFALVAFVLFARVAWLSERHDMRWNAAMNLVVTDLRLSAQQAVRDAAFQLDDATDAAQRAGTLAAEALEDAVEPPAPFDNALADIRARQTLILATTNEPTTYFVGRAGPKGFEYEMARAYARHLGVDLEVEVFPGAAAVMDAVEAGKAHLGAAHLKRTPANERLATFGPTFLTTSERLVCERDGVRISDVQDLARVDIVVPAGSPFIDTLEERRQEGWPVSWRVSDALTTQMLAAVADHRIDCTVADEQVFEVNRRYFPNLVSDLQITKDRQIAWALPGGRKSVSASLRDDIAAWLDQEQTLALREDLDDAYFAYYEEFDYVDLQRFRRAIRDRLPRYRELFERYGLEEDIDWRLIAAVAWQESRWNPDAVSPTGVRGLMMLTRRTAKSVGVTDRTDPEQAVEGGAEYLSRMRERVPDDVQPRDRWWFATAAYNVGLGHVLDARALARRLQRDDHRWRHVRETLPLLEDPEYYRQVRYGYARGREPVRYVRRIRQFQDILEKRFPVEGEDSAAGA